MDNNLESIEVVRAALCTLTYRANFQFEPVHILRIKSVCERLGLTEAIPTLLAQLKLLREVEDLGAGYWAPTAQRFVSFPNVNLVVSPNPTTEIRRWLRREVQCAGIGRVTERETIVPLPEESIDQWIGSPADLIAWTKNILDRATANLMPTTDPKVEISIYAPWRKSRHSSGGGRWCRLVDLTVEEMEKKWLEGANRPTGSN